MCRRTLISHFSALLVLLGSIASVIAQTAPQSRPEQERPRLESRGKKGDDDQRPTPGQPQPQSQTDESGTIKIDTTLVTIPVSVLDRDGKYVPNLSKRDFQIYEDGVQQEIADFSLVEVPFNVVLLLDTSRSTVFRLEDIQHAAVAFVEQLRPQDRVMVVSFDDKIYIDSEFTSDRARLRRAIYGTRTGGGTKLYDAVDLVITERLNRMDGRKAIVMFTDGVDTTSKFAKADSTIDLVEESGVLVYPIHYDTEDQRGRIFGGNGRGGQGPVITTPWPLPPIQIPRGRRWPFDSNATPQQWPRGGGGRGHGNEYERGAEYLRSLAERSGARLYHAESLQNVEQSFAMIAEELRHQYALSYYPTNAAHDGSYRHIRVKVNRLNLAIRTRDGYRAAGDKANSSAGSSDEKQTRPRLTRERP